MQTVDDLEVAGRTVLVRSDLNVPLKDGVITDDKRIQASLPTIRDLAGRGARVVVLAHLGRPKGEVKPELSLRPVAQRLQELLGQPVGFPETAGGGVAGPAALWHSRIRTEAFTSALAAYGMRGATVETDYSAEQGAAATRRLLEGDARPSAILYDNDVMAVAGLGVAHHLGIPVPGEISLVAWDDSPLCEVIQPGLTALHRDIAGYGAEAARHLRRIVAGEQAGDVQVAGLELVERGSTGPAPRSG